MGDNIEGLTPPITPASIRKRAAEVKPKINTAQQLATAAEKAEKIRLRDLKFNTFWQKLETVLPGYLLEQLEIQAEQGKTSFRLYLHPDDGAAINSPTRQWFEQHFRDTFTHSECERLWYANTAQIAYLLAEKEQLNGFLITRPRDFIIQIEPARYWGFVKGYWSHSDFSTFYASGFIGGLVLFGALMRLSRYITNLVM